MCNILEDTASDLEMFQNVSCARTCILFPHLMRPQVLERISSWPLLQRNKINDSKIEEPLKALTTCENETIRDVAEKVWLIRLDFTKKADPAIVARILGYS